MNCKERLTMHTSEGACLIIDANNEVDARQELHDKFKLACNKLAELEDKLENGTLIDVLCKVQQRIISDVLDERKRQDTKWGEQNHSPDKWGNIIGEEYGEVCKAINEFGFNPTPQTEQDIYTEAIQTMASCMAMLECMERCRQKSKAEGVAEWLNI